jgi:hypothetical protein
VTSLGTALLLMTRLLAAAVRQIPAPAVLLYSAYADALLTIPARLAGSRSTFTGGGVTVRGRIPARRDTECPRSCAAGAHVMLDLVPSR